MAAARALRIGSLCTGYGGLDMAVTSVVGGHLSWISDIEPGPCKVLARRHPDVPNIGDLTTCDFSTVERVDVLTAGYPCQPFSQAGRRRGTKDERHIWPDIRDAIGTLGPRLVVLENVAGHLSLGGPTVVGELASLGYDVRWVVVRASDVGACHRRARLFIVADAHSDIRGRRSQGVLATQDRERSWRYGDGPSDGCGATASNARGGGRVGQPAIEESARKGSAERRENLAELADPDGPVVDWGKYEPAIRRHERALGRRAPNPRGPRGLLSPRFVEWMQMLPDGWVTDVPMSRSAHLRLLGNGVVSPQATYGLRLLGVGQLEVAA